MKRGLLLKILCAAAAAIVLTACLYSDAGVWAASKSFEKDGWTFLITDSENRLVTIKKAPEDTEAVTVIPSMVIHGKKTYTVTGIANAAFAFSGIEEAIIPETVTTIGSSAFTGCRELKSVYIPDSVTSIGCGAFSYCSVLTNVEIGSGNEAYVFSEGILYSADRTELVWASQLAGSSCTVPEGVLKILPYAFEGNSTVKKVKLSSTLLKIGTGAFMDCSSLKNVSIPKSVKTIEGNPFMYCPALESISVAKGSKYYCATEGGLLLNAKKTTLVSASAVKGDLVLPESIKKIVKGAAAGNPSITSVTFDAKLKTVEAYAFADCGSLSKIVFKSRKTGLAKDGEIFKNTAYYLDVTVPYSSEMNAEGGIEDMIRRNSPNGVIITWR